MNEYWFLYNMKQADYFIKSGLVPIGVCKGSKNDTYIQFVRNEESEQVQNSWLKIKCGDMPRPPKQN